MAALPSSDDDRPATRRDLAKEREILEARFGTVDAKFDAVRAEIAGLRREMRILLGIVMVMLSGLVGLNLGAG